MRSVWKFEVPIKDRFEIAMPERAVIMHFATQQGEPMLWALVDTDAPLERRRFRLAGTGHSLPDNSEVLLKPIGSVVLPHGALVFHLFECD